MESLIKLKKWHKINEKKKSKLNKKGSFLDIIFIIVIVSAFIILTVIANMVYTNVHASFLSNGLDNGTTTAGPGLAFDKMNTTFSVFDYGFPFIYLAFVIAAVVGAFMMDSHPIFLVVGIFMFLIVSFIGYVFWYQYSNLVAISPDFASASANFKVFPLFMDNFILINVISAAIIIIVTVAKLNIGGGG
jgi:hypothetical protein